MAAMELFDLVNEKDEIIGITNKEESHGNGAIHRVAAVYVFDKDGKLYVQEHIKSGRLDHSVGGHVGKGETYDEAAKRESFEELGLTDSLISISRFYSDERISGVNIRHYFGLYECRPNPNWKFQANEEVKNIFPMEINEVVQSMNESPERFTGGFINSMEEYVKQKKLPLRLVKPDLKKISPNKIQG